MFNDVCAGLINRKLDRINVALIQTRRSSHLLDELANFLQAIQPARECFGSHRLETTHRGGDIVKDFKVLFHPNQFKRIVNGFIYTSQNQFPAV